MKKITMLFLLFLGMAGLTACASDKPNTQVGNKTTIEMELDKNYDDIDPFVNEKLFCVSEDLNTLDAEGTLGMDGESIILELKNNKTNEVLWNNTWEGNVESKNFSLQLENLKKDDEYVISLTGSGINHVTIEIAFDSNLVQERVRPLK